MTNQTRLADRRHIGLHLTHRWFAYFEAPGGNLETHLTMFHPQVRLTGRRGAHLFVSDHQSLAAWLEAASDFLSSHHILHSVYSDKTDRWGLLSMTIAYQAPSEAGIHGSIISYETQVEFAPTGARFTSLDKTPILPNTRPDYETSWAENRVLGRIHAELGGITESEGQLRAIHGEDVRQVVVEANAPEGSRSYEALVTSTGGNPVKSRSMRLQIADNANDPLPTIKSISPE